MIRSKIIPNAGCTILIIVSLAAGIYFRTYSLRFNNAPAQALLQQQAERNVRSGIEAQVRTQLGKVLTESPAAADGLVRERVASLIQADSDNYREAVSKMKDSLTKARQAYYSPHYLLEADPYYYYMLTDNLVQTGSMGGPSRGGRFLNPLRRAPTGNYDYFTLHPYFGWLVYRVWKIIDSKAELMMVLNFVPLILTGLMVLALLTACASISLGFIAAFWAIMAVVLSPIVIQRSAYGWYDTDPYNIIFPLLIFASGAGMIRQSSRFKFWGITGGLLTGLFSLFWTGWPFILFLNLGVFGLIGVLDLFSVSRRKDFFSWKYIFFYVASSVISAMICRTPAGFFESVAGAFSFVFKTSGSSASQWPNLFLMIGETNPASFEKMIQLLGNLMTVIVAALTFGLGFGLAAYRRNFQKLRLYIYLALTAVPMAVLGLKAERFVLLAAAPAGMCLGLGIQAVQELAAEWGGRIKFFNHGGRLAAAAAGLGLSLLLIYPALIHAHVAANLKSSIMNDAWMQAMTSLRERTPEDSIVFSGWSPGHFVTSLARRRVVVDGGGQAQRENYWIAKALMSHDEKNAAAIFRMLASGGNQALGLLEKKGWDLAAAELWIRGLILMSRQKASQEIPEFWTPEEKKEFLDSLFGDGRPAPGYVLLYNDLIEKNKLLQFLDRWDFQKAKELKAPKTNFTDFLRSFTQNQPQAYFQHVFKVMGDLLPYENNLKLKDNTGPLYEYEQGLRVDVSSGTAVLPLTVQGKTLMEPLRVILRQGDTWVDRPSPARLRPIAVILEYQGNGLSPVLLHQDLLDTLLFKLYYFQGSGMRYFKPLELVDEPQLLTRVQVYEILWEEFLRDHES